MRRIHEAQPSANELSRSLPLRTSASQRSRFAPALDPRLACRSNPLIRQSSGQPCFAKLDVGLWHIADDVLAALTVRYGAGCPAATCFGEPPESAHPSPSAQPGRSLLTEPTADARLCAGNRSSCPLDASERSPAKNLSMVKQPGRAHGRRPALQPVWSGNAHRWALGCARLGLSGGVGLRPIEV